MQKTFLTVVAGIALFLFAACPLFADEGMWTFDNLPMKELKEKHDFVPTQQWLDHIRLSSVRFQDGGSGSFISENGLTLTNHHVAVGQLQKMSSKEKDYVKDGFYAETPDKEVKCTDLELNVLVDMKDVTARVENSFKNLKGEAAIKARKAEIAAIEKESLDKTGMKSSVVSLYNGGEYWLYVYKKYRDVRLVFAPEKQAAFFGGDRDNFTYPRYDLDFAIFRVYENDKPLKCKNFMRMNPNGAKDGDTVFVSGHPGTTKRELTLAQYLFNRDYIYPISLDRTNKMLETLRAYSKRGAEEKRQAATMIFYLENTYKAFSAEYKGLKNSEFTSRFAAKEKALREQINANSQLKKEVGNSYENIEKALAMVTKRFNELTYSTLAGSRIDNNLASIANQIVFYSAEITKPDKDRLEGYHDAEIDNLKYGILSPAPVYKAMQQEMLTLYMQMALDKLGKDYPTVKLILDGKSPAERAKELFANSKLADINYRKALLDGGRDAVLKSDDPFIKLALKLEPYQRELISWQEKEIEPLITPSREKIAAAKFKVYGKSIYPDATFTLRLAIGKVRGYEYNGTIAPAHTTFYGMFDRYYSFLGNSGWALSDRVISSKERLKMETPLNFVSDNDITGGNSGSPTIDKNGNVVGLIFDGNIESLPGRFIFDPAENRAVSVHTAGILEAMRNIYGAGKLVDEILNN